MLVDAMRAYSEHNNELADAVIARDDQVDILYHRGIEALQKRCSTTRASCARGPSCSSR